MAIYQRPKMTCEHCGARFLPGSHFVCGGLLVATVEGLAAITKEGRAAWLDRNGKAN